MGNRGNPLEPKPRRILRTGLGVYSTIITLRNPRNPILIVKAPT